LQKYSDVLGCFTLNEFSKKSAVIYDDSDCKAIVKKFESKNGGFIPTHGAERNLQVTWMGIYLSRRD
jgi:hypothetical protein